MRRSFLAILFAGALFAADPALDRLKRAVEQAKVLNDDGEHKDEDERLAEVHASLRLWFEARLPHGTRVNAGSLAAVEANLNDELKAGGLVAQGQPPDDDPIAEMGLPGYGYPSLEFKLLPEFVNAAFVIAHVSVPCGSNALAYMYDFSGPAWRQIFADGPGSAWGRSNPTLEASDADRMGNRLLLIHYRSAQCQSTWMGTTFSIRRIGVNGDQAETLLSMGHGFWLGNDGPEFVLKPDELIVEFLDRSVDAGVHNRTQIHRYKFAPGAQRIDPVAFQPQDFAEEWLTRPWSEMASRSTDGLKETHERLHDDGLIGTYAGVTPCAALANQWLVDIEIEKVNGDKIETVGEAFLLVRDLGGYRYKMEAVTEERPEGCPGEGIKSGVGVASDKHPWLSREELLRLP